MVYGKPSGQVVYHFALGDQLVNTQPHIRAIGFTAVSTLRRASQVRDRLGRLVRNQ